MRQILCLLYVLCIMAGMTASACDPLTSSREQFLWKQPLSDGKLIEGELPNILYNGTIIALGIRASKKILYAFDATTGENRWQWSDWFLNDRYVLVDYVYNNNDILVISNRGTNYGINTRTGTTQWSNNPFDREGGTRGASGLGEWYFFGADISAQQSYIIRGSIYRNSEQILITMPRATGAFHSTPFITQNGDTMLVYFSTYGEAATNFRNRTFINLYNVSKHQEIYTLLQDTSSPENANVLTGGAPVLREKNIYSAIGRSVQANDLETGKLIWKTKTQEPFTTSGIIEGDGIIFGNSSDGFMHAFDSQTGKLLWKIETFGTARRPFYMNGVVYVVSPGGGKLYAFDGKTGTKIWDFLSPDNGQGAGSSFTGIVTGANGKIYVRSYLNLYCYKAAR